MFGWFMILGTAVMQKYGLFPNPDVPLQYKDWGALTQQVRRRLGRGLSWVRTEHCRGQGLTGSPDDRALAPQLHPDSPRTLTAPRTPHPALAHRTPHPQRQPHAHPHPHPRPAQGFGTFITNERAIIMIAHIHALVVSAAAAFGPQVSAGL